MAQHLNWGILATGRIASRFADGLARSKTGSLMAVGSRRIETAEAFCSAKGGRPVEGYQAVLDDPNVEAVYIATPHHLHAEWTAKAARAGKAILCEKPFTLNAKEAEAALAEVRKAGVFFMEAFMYRCHPQIAWLLETIRSGKIGVVEAVHAEFAFNAPKPWQDIRADAAHGGGGLMDVGTYAISFARLIAGEEPTEACYFAKFGEAGYDEHGSGSLRFPGGVTAHFGCGVHVTMANSATVFGSEGRVVLEDPWVATKPMRLYVSASDSWETHDMSGAGDLYAFEADAVAAHSESGECPFMTVADTLGNMRTLDRLRASCGLRFATDDA